MEGDIGSKPEQVVAIHAGGMRYLRIQSSVSCWGCKHKGTGSTTRGVHGIGRWYHGRSKLIGSGGCPLATTFAQGQSSVQIDGPRGFRPKCQTLARIGWPGSTKGLSISDLQGRWRSRQWLQVSGGLAVEVKPGWIGYCWWELWPQGWCALDGC